MVKKKVTVILKEDIHTQLKTMAVKNNKKVSDVYEEVLEEGLRIFKEQSTLEDYKTEGANTEEESKEVESIS